MQIVSYAQNFEDVILYRALRHIERGRYIDVGAQDPQNESVSLMFYQLGWRGVHVEPVPEYAQKLRDARPEEEVIQAIVCSSHGSADFYQITGTGLSTSKKEIAEQHKAAGFSCERMSVSALPLSKILDRFEDVDIHWLKIDVEGMEHDVIRSWLPSKVRPWIVLVEATAPNSQIQMHEDWEHLIISLGYRFVYFDGLNRFYVSKGHEELIDSFGPGPNVFDNFILANVLTLSEERKRLQREIDALKRLLPMRLMRFFQSMERFVRSIRKRIKHLV